MLDRCFFSEEVDLNKYHLALTVEYFIQEHFSSTAIN